MVVTGLSRALGKMATSTHCGECLSKKTLLAHRRLYYDKFSGFEVDDIDFMDEDGTGESSSNQKQSESPPPLVEFGSADNEGMFDTFFDPLWLGQLFS